MLKKAFSFLLAVILTITVAACSDSNGSSASVKEFCELTAKAVSEVRNADGDINQLNINAELSEKFVNDTTALTVEDKEALQRSLKELAKALIDKTTADEEIEPAVKEKGIQAVDKKIVSIVDGSTTLGEVVKALNNE